MSRKVLIDDDAAQYGALEQRIKRLEQSDSVPTGAIALWRSGTAVPVGWLQCDGTSFSATSYPQLNALWGTTTLPPNPGLTGYIAIVRVR